MNILALDASTKSTGWAYYENNDLISWGTFTASSSDVIKRISSMIAQLEKFLRNKQIDKIILEEVRPQEQKDETGNYHSVKTFKALIYLQAAIVFLIHERCSNIDIVFVYPNEWRSKCGIKTGPGIKRQDLKEADINFTKKEFNIQEYINDDMADAICIGLSYLKTNNSKLTKSNEINWE